MATSDKYDRQIRLWGANGQRSLMKSHILLINADIVGTEALKNLVLPGVGSFTILDDHVVNHHDLGGNFFTLISTIGKPRAEVVAELLSEMNDDVSSNSRVANFTNVMQTDPEFFGKFSLIIGANMLEQEVLPLANLCMEMHVPLMLLRSYGLIGSVRVQLQSHDIIESKTDSDSLVLRILNPFGELKTFFDSFDFDTLDSMAHAHIPYVVILYKALQKWYKQNSGTIPKSFAEKNQFKEMIKSMSRNYNMELNFQEAVKESYRAFTDIAPMEVSSTKNELQPKSRIFEFLMKALDIFRQENDGNLPLNGKVADMTSSTEWFIQLQAIYLRKAQEDMMRLKSITINLMKMVGREASDDFNETVELFCKNASQVTSITTRSIADEMNLETEIICSNSDLKMTEDDNSVEKFSISSYMNGILQDELFETDPCQTPLLWYLNLRAVDRFHTKYARWPGENGMNTFLLDETEVFNELKRLVNEYKLEDTLSLVVDNEVENHSSPEGLLNMNHAKEITRYGGMELHNISAIIGGVVAQEAVKIITHQYIPINNTYIYNGICCCAATYEL